LRKFGDIKEYKKSQTLSIKQTENDLLERSLA